MKYTVPSDQIFSNLHMTQIFHIINPVHQIKFVFEMIIETFFGSYYIFAQISETVIFAKGVVSISSFSADASALFVILESANFLSSPFIYPLSIKSGYISAANNAAPSAPQS